MRWCALCHIGGETALASELGSFGVSPEKYEGGCSFEADEALAARIAYHSQTATRLLKMVYAGERKGLSLEGYEKLIPKEDTFRITCSVEQGDETAMELASELGKDIDRKVNLDKPDHVIYVQLAGSALAGIDVTGDMSKRYYRIFANARSIKGTLAATMLWLHPIQGDVLDPFSNTGEIAIEAAMRATNTSPLKYSRQQARLKLPEDEEVQARYKTWCLDPQLGNLRSCKKNAKLAGVDKAIGFSKLDAEWLDVKFESGTIGLVITIPQQVTSRNKEDKHLRELCYQAGYILRKGGRLVVCCITDETASAVEGYAKKYKLRKIDESIIYSGKQPHRVLCYGL